MGLNSSLNAEAFRFMAQLGVQDVVLNTPPVPVKDGKWELVDLVGLKNRVDEFGLKLNQKVFSQSWPQQIPCR